MFGCGSPPSLLAVGGSVGVAVSGSAVVSEEGSAALFVSFVLTSFGADVCVLPLSVLVLSVLSPAHAVAKKASASIIVTHLINSLCIG